MVSRTPSPAAFPGDRIAKVMARAGLCSRRDAERLIAEGRVSLNGTVADLAGGQCRSAGQRAGRRPAAATGRAAETVALSQAGRAARQPMRPAGAADRLRRGCRRRCRASSRSGGSISTREGLLLLTNDGELARLLELPATGWLRRYRVRAFGAVDPAALARLKDGITIEGIRYGADRGGARDGFRAQCLAAFAMREGKNREVKKVARISGSRSTG